MHKYIGLFFCVCEYILVYEFIYGSFCILLCVSMFVLVCMSLFVSLSNCEYMSMWFIYLCVGTYEKDNLIYVIMAKSKIGPKLKIKSCKPLRIWDLGTCPSLEGSKVSRT